MWKDESHKAEDLLKQSNEEQDVNFRYELLERSSQAYKRAATGRINSAFLRAVCQSDPLYKGRCEELYHIDDRNMIRIDQAEPFLV